MGYFVDAKAVIIVKGIKLDRNSLACISAITHPNATLGIVIIIFALLFALLSYCISNYYILVVLKSLLLFALLYFTIIF